MTLIAAVTQAHDPDGQQAGARAAQEALSQLNRTAPVIAFVTASHDYPIHSVLRGVSARLGETPLLGFSSMPELHSSRQPKPSVTVGLLAGGEIRARADWWPGFYENIGPGSDGNTPDASDSQPVIQRMLQAFSPAVGDILLFIADGLSSDAITLVHALRTASERTRSRAGENLSLAGTQVAGCLAEADPGMQRCGQIGGRQAGSAGLSAALIEGRIALGIGAGHGWQPVGPYFRVTRSHGRWIDHLDGRPAVESYARLFGNDPEDWRKPPLNRLIRLYPLGLEGPGGDWGCVTDCPYLVRTPIWVEEDGSLRMNTSIPEGMTAHLLVGSASACLEAARQSAHQALASLARLGGETRAVFALVWVDAAWLKMLEGQPGCAIQAVRSVLGPHVPVLGGFTYGQIVPQPPTGFPELLNQHIQVLVFGEPGLAE